MADRQSRNDIQPSRITELADLLRVQMGTVTMSLRSESMKPVLQDLFSCGI
jgi:hypothetical protein